ncbi:MULTISPECIES: DUF2523 family protein [Aeromonas]|jgi:hypothetical protein|uniref:DUF2523 family protein n=1 Tax=Aeromonas TaxID=642 RepID=UPI000E8670DF|nr:MULTISPECIES: DUF2523 family protein [Aeromonas]MDM5127362.1 DUF2523 domain-containing protein [Aeromonas salmonicida]MDM5134523.1 DUF2523 domain-containing protein [Aeromonas salmonicida]MDQ1882377.1 DUF2523 family protein [Aeromonas salmonicida]WHF42342.1 DUF2523 family protein [Aeromonas salmonicida]HBL02210.1 accessory cholera enterotoxin [Aeromonas salmonicida]
MEWLGEFFNSFFADIYQLAVQFGAWLAIRLAVQWVEFKLFLLTFTWDVAKEILVNVHFSELLSSSFNSLPPTMKGILLYIHLDKGLTILTQAFVTRFMLNMMGW